MKAASQQNKSKEGIRSKMKPRKERPYRQTENYEGYKTK